MLFLIVHLVYYRSAESAILSFSPIDFFIQLKALITNYSLLIPITIFILFGAITRQLISLDHDPNPVSSKDERGVSYLKGGTFGTSRWMTAQEAKERFIIGNVLSVTNTIYGRFDSSEGEVVAYKGRPGGGNRHLMLIGSSGSGKSVSFIRTEIIQSLRRGESVVVTDPSAELYTDLACYARGLGVDVKVLNLSSPPNGNGWDCLSECINPLTLSLDSSRLNDFADIYMRNTGLPGNSDSFWFYSETNLLKAAIGLCEFRRRSFLINAYANSLSSLLRAKDYPADQINAFMTAIKASSHLQDALSLFVSLAQTTGLCPFDLDLVIEEIDKAAPAFSISEVYNIVLSMDDEESLRREFLSIPMTHPAAVAYSTYSSHDTNEKIKASIRMGLLNRMQLFNDHALKGVLSIDDLHLSEISQRQTALFIITPDKSDAFKPISSLVYSFLFKDLSDEWDREQARSQQADCQNERLPVSIIMDEFYSIGYIPSFPVFIATCRKRLLNVSIALQNISQLYDLYGNNGGDTILSCCDTLLFLGCNDYTTAKFISSFCAGEATVKSTSINSPNHVSFDKRGQNISIHESTRKLITPDEARRFIDGVLVLVRGEQPLRLLRFPFYDHPVCKAGLLKKSNVYEIPSILLERNYADSIDGLTLNDLYNRRK